MYRTWWLICHIVLYFFNILFKFSCRLLCIEGTTATLHPSHLVRTVLACVVLCSWRARVSASRLLVSQFVTSDNYFPRWRDTWSHVRPVGRGGLALFPIDLWASQSPHSRCSQTASTNDFRPSGRESRTQLRIMRCLWAPLGHAERINQIWNLCEYLFLCLYL